jgi:hypothetical protein
MIMKLILLVLAGITFFYALNAFGPVPLLINAVLALIALKIIGFLGIKIETSWWTILILVLWGLPGLLVLMFLALTGIAFRGR